MSKVARAAASGLLAGIVLTGAAVWFALPALMLVTRPSNHGYEETVSRLQQSLASRPDWRSLAVNDYQKSVAPFAALERVGSVNVCNPRYASRILANDADRGVTAFMPLSIGVFENRDGQVYVARLNVGLLGMMFGGTIADVMGDAGADLDAVVASATAP